MIGSLTSALAGGGEVEIGLNLTGAENAGNRFDRIAKKAAIFNRVMTTFSPLAAEDSFSPCCRAAAPASSA